MSAAMVPFFALVPLEVIPTFLRFPLFGPLATYLRHNRIFPRFQFVLILSDEYAVTIICRFSELAQPAKDRRETAKSTTTAMLKDLFIE
jgi:hypothetical protein